MPDSNQLLIAHHPERLPLPSRIRTVLPDFHRRGLSQSRRLYAPSAVSRICEENAVELGHHAHYAPPLRCYPLSKVCVSRGVARLLICFCSESCILQSQRRKPPNYYNKVSPAAMLHRSPASSARCRTLGLLPFCAHCCAPIISATADHPRATRATVDSPAALHGTTSQTRRPLDQSNGDVTPPKSPTSLIVISPVILSDALSDSAPPSPQSCRCKNSALAVDAPLQAGDMLY